MLLSTSPTSLRDYTTQSFTGSGCAQSPATSCRCTHLTDFSAGRALPAANGLVAAVVSASAVPPLPQSDRMRMLSGFVFGLFGMMVATAAASFAADCAARRRVLAKVHGARLGFTKAEGTAAWLWSSFSLDPIDNHVGRVDGSLARLAAVIGLPAIRLRAAIPSALIRGSAREALGRSKGISADAVHNAAPEYEAFVRALYGLRGARPPQQAPRGPVGGGGGLLAAAEAGQSSPAKPLQGSPPPHEKERHASPAHKASPAAAGADAAAPDAVELVDARYVRTSSTGGGQRPAAPPKASGFAFSRAQEGSSRGGSKRATSMRGPVGGELGSRRGGGALGDGSKRASATGGDGSTKRGDGSKCGGGSGSGKATGSASPTPHQRRAEASPQRREASPQRRGGASPLLRKELSPSKRDASPSKRAAAGPHADAGAQPHGHHHYHRTSSTDRDAAKQKLTPRPSGGDDDALDLERKHDHRRSSQASGGSEARVSVGGGHGGRRASASAAGDPAAAQQHQGKPHHHHHHDLGRASANAAPGREEPTLASHPMGLGRHTGDPGAEQRAEGAEGEKARKHKKKEKGKEKEKKDKEEKVAPRERPERGHAVEKRKEEALAEAPNLACALRFETLFHSLRAGALAALQDFSHFLLPDKRTCGLLPFHLSAQRPPWRSRASTPSPSSRRRKPPTATSRPPPTSATSRSTPGAAAGAPPTSRRSRTSTRWWKPSQRCSRPGTSAPAAGGSPRRARGGSCCCRPRTGPGRRRRTWRRRCWRGRWGRRTCPRTWAGSAAERRREEKPPRSSRATAKRLAAAFWKSESRESLARRAAP